MSTPENKSYLSAGISNISNISAFSPWASRSATPRSQPAQDNEDGKSDSGLVQQRGGDHVINPRHRLSLKSYPRDCPPLNVQWFHAVDYPKRKPLPGSNAPSNTDKPVQQPKKWMPFSAGDSRAIEATFQKLADEAEATKREKELLNSPRHQGQDDTSPKTDTRTKVPVNEDFLFDVDIETRELAPAYWLGPVWDVRRGTWFRQDGSPCDENLATQLEEGYLKAKSWRFTQNEKRAVSQSRSRPTSMTFKGDDAAKATNQSISTPVTPRGSSDSLRGDAEAASAGASGDSASLAPPQEDMSTTHRLFGTYMNSVVTYQDATTAYLLRDDYYSRMSGTVYQRFAGGAHYAGERFTRGYVDPTKKKKDGKGDDKQPATAGTTSAEENKDGLAYGSDTNTGDAVSEDEDNEPVHSPSEARRKTLERQLSTLVTSGEPEDLAKQEEESRRRDEKEIRDDYKEQSNDEQGREIEHLLLVTHGIGQRLGMRMESVNFVHDVNTFRKALKAVYANTADLQALNSDLDNLTKNSRVQVLPICWRHLLDFPKQSLKHNRKEHDLGELDFEDQDYPNLEDITVEGVPAVRNLITDLALDILLYQSPAYKGHISRIVLQECNRIYRLFKERNPTFNGKVSLVGHSLGSAIMFDILCQQRASKSSSNDQRPKHRRQAEEDLKLDFEVEDFYALGSPIGLFQMLKGRTIAARQGNSFLPPETPIDSSEDPFSPAQQSSSRAFEITTSSPKCAQVFNIFHPTDPIAYRIEPLISAAMAGLKPQPLPYTKKGIFGAPVGQGLTGIGARVGQSVNTLWSQMYSGIASGILNRSLGISGADADKMRVDLNPPQKTSRPLSIGAGTNVSGGVVPGNSEPGPAALTSERQKRLGEEEIMKGEEGEHPPTLIENEIETLFAGFQKRRKSQESANPLERELEVKELEERGRRLRREEGRVRALNGNGRVDYSIQEGAFDISFLASIASHLSYWQDEDVSHFMISQLLARHRVFKKNKSAEELKASK